MPSVYEIRHLELDNVGRSKRLVRPPGGDSSDIFGTRSPSVNGSIPSSPSTPGSSNPGSRRGSLRGDDSKNRLFGDHEHGSNGSLHSLASPRRVRDTMKSTIFRDDVCDSPKPSPKKASTCTPARRNPITGEVALVSAVSSLKIDGHTGNGIGNGHSNGHTNGNNSVSNGHAVHHSNGSANGGGLLSVAVSSTPAVPLTPSRQPPGGKCAGIF